MPTARECVKMAKTICLIMNDGYQPEAAIDYIESYLYWNWGFKQELAHSIALDVVTVKSLFPSLCVDDYALGLLRGRVLDMHKEVSA